MNIPVLVISGMVKYPEPKTTAFGGVATGNINAHDAAMVADTNKTYGFISRPTAIGASIGNNIAVVATLEVISVRKLTLTTITRINSIKDNP